jgi:Lar family restriction alleviation protein
MTELTLKPCPFCGKVPLRKHFAGPHWQLVHLCEIGGYMMYWEGSAERLVERWNTRAP